MSKLSELAKQDRLSKGMTQAQYAKAMGFESPTAVSLWEAGKRRVPETVIEVIFELEPPLYIRCPTCSGTGTVKKEKP